MRRSAVLGVLVVCLWFGGPLEAGAVISEEEFEAMKKRLGIVEKELADVKKHEAEEAKVKEKKEGEKPLSVGTTGSGKLIYAKPFVSAPKATVGGYMDFETNFLTDRNLTRTRATNFEVARFIPFIYSDVTDRIKVAAELEFEHGGPNNVGGGGEVKIEFATIDYLITEPLNFRGGILLMPVGKFNLLHDSPLNDLTDRPLVSRLIIPSTWFEPGLGFYGTVYPTRLSKLDYEIYAVNGFAADPGATTGARITDAGGLREARGNTRTDNNNNKGVVGRVAFSPLLGIEVAGSAAHAAYDPNADKQLTIWAIDWTLQRGPFEVIGEAAMARISDNFSGATIGPAGMRGYYIQGNYHFLPSILKKWAPTHITDASTFTMVVRWDDIDTDTDNRTLTATGGNTGELQRLTLGLNFRPIEDTVFKLDYQFNSQLGTNLSPGNNSRVDGNGFLFSVATYF